MCVMLASTSSFMIRVGNITVVQQSLTYIEVYPRLALSQRNPLPIQIPPTYSHSRHPKGDHSSQGNRFQTRPMFTCTRADPLEFWAQIIGIILQAGPLPKESSPNSNPSHLQPLPPPYRGPLLPGDRYQTRPMRTCT